MSAEYPSEQNFEAQETKSEHREGPLEKIAQAFSLIINGGFRKNNQEAAIKPGVVKDQSYSFQIISPDFSESAWYDIAQSNNVIVMHGRIDHNLNNLRTRLKFYFSERFNLNLLIEIVQTSRYHTQLFAALLDYVYQGEVSVFYVEESMDKPDAREQLQSSFSIKPKQKDQSLDTSHLNYELAFEEAKKLTE